MPTRGPVVGLPSQREYFQTPGYTTEHQHFLRDIKHSQGQALAKASKRAQPEQNSNGSELIEGVQVQLKVITKGKGNKTQREEGGKVEIRTHISTH